ncbi:MAG: tetratricopeptide repeat protein [Dehalococcoidales bacterium]|nr:tetratricopeptide repeat protein [Dehalococcoidales bacterium]
MAKEDLTELQSIWDEARRHIESGNHEKAIEIYKYILVRYGDDAVAVEYANAYLADLYLTLQKPDLTESHIQKAIKLKPENPGYRYILGFAYSYRKQWDKAIPQFEAAVKIKPDNGEYLRGLGWAKYSSGNVAEGLAILEQASRLVPDNANILTDLAVVSLSLPDMNKAREYAERAVRLDPANIVAQDVLHNVMVFSQRLSQSEKQPAAKKARTSSYADTHFIHRFKVSLKNNPDIWRIIDIKENQMLSSLHNTIFKAFDRIEEHEYSFFLSNKPYGEETEFTSLRADASGGKKLAARIRIDSLALYGGPKFLYLFDYGDEWWHEVELISVTRKVTRASYPKVVKKQGKSPLQYPKL